MAAALEDRPRRSSVPVQLELAKIRMALASTVKAADPSCGMAAAAVALVLRELPSAGPATNGQSPELLLIRRAERRDDPWSGHMALPGGRREEKDQSLLHTALRETFEEVGLQLDRSAQLIGRLPPLQAVAQGRPVGLTIVPLVFQLSVAAELRANHEVAEALWVPLSRLQSGELDSFVEGSLLGCSSSVTQLPAWTIEGRIVWGLTHRMISDFFNLLDFRADSA